MKSVAFPAKIVILSIPFIAYLAVLLQYILDIPVWDDYVNPLDITNQAIAATALTDKLAILATPMNGHTPFLPRALLYVQYLAGVTTPIHTALVISNLGWMAVTLLVMVYCYRSLQMELALLIPLPYLLLSLIHWEAMDFYSSAFQMYWGSGLLIVAGLMLLVSGWTITASLFFLGGLFASGGALAAYPVSLLFLLGTRRWKALLVFIGCSVPALWLYAHINVEAQAVRELPQWQPLLAYVFEFTGNLTSNGQWDLSSHARYHQLLGALMTGLAAFLAWRVPGHYVFKLLFAYVVLMGAMAGYMRMDVYSHAVSRYSMYALLAAVSLYILLLAWLGTLPQGTAARKILPLLITVASVALWVHSLLLCQEPLQQNRDSRSAHMQSYIQTGDPAVLDSWNAAHAQKVLDDSRQSGLYDYKK